MNVILDYSIHVANVMYLFSYLVRDILWLRCLTILAGSCLLPFYLLQPDPLLAPVAWNLVFITINIVQTVLLFLERRPVHLEGKDLKLHQLLFDRISPRDFKKLLKIGDWRQANTETHLISEGEALDALFVIFDGEVQIRKNGKPLLTLDSGHFIGEMSFLTGEKTTADVVALQDTHFLQLPFPQLREILKKHPTLQAAFQNIIGADLVKKLKSH